MARPCKSGIDYFPLNVALDDKVKLIEAEFGLTGFAVVVKLWQKIYGQEGYYCEWTEEVALLFSRELGLGGNTVSEIVSATLRRGLFDRELFDKYKILTSQGIQTRYFEAVGRRKGLEVKKQYLLVNIDKNSINVNINSINVSNNEENVCNNPQIKENKSKVNKNKINNIYAPTEEKKTVRHKYGEYENVLLSDNDLEKLKSEYPNDYEKRIERLSEYIASTGKSYKNHLATIRSWAKKDKSENQKRHSIHCVDEDEDTLDDLF